MLINGLTLPDSFIQDIAAGRFKRAKGSWRLREPRDAYGNHLETELADVFDTPEAIAQHTRELPNGFEPDEYYGQEPKEDEEQAEGWIPDIVDFTMILCFGMAGDDAPFCFDFRDAPSIPSVVWWDDTYWRRIAPDYSRFIDLFAMDELRVLTQIAN
jgi:hypothetical protein